MVRCNFRGEIPIGSSEPSNPQQGDMFWVPYYHGELKNAYCRWDDEICNDKRGHLMVILPCGHVWDIDTRANNCTMKEDRHHKCWIRHGEPPNITVDKQGKTCQAGAGSIACWCGKYHGFLKNGVLT